MEYDAADRINSCWTAWFLKMEREGGPETSVTNYQPRPRNKLQQRRPDFKGLAQRINYERDKTSGSVAHSTGNFATRWPSDGVLQKQFAAWKWAAVWKK